MTTSTRIASMPISTEIGPTVISLRHDIRPQHPVFGEAWRKLSDHELLQDSDQSACVSVLLSLHGGRWVNVGEEFPHNVGKTVREACDLQQDFDGYERVFRRRVQA